MEQDQEGAAARERGEGWVDREWAAAEEEAEWAGPGPDREAVVSVRSAEPPLPISWVAPVIRLNALNAALLWPGRKIQR